MLKNQKGFTLIELIIVIVIIGILAAVAVPKFLDLSASAKIATCKQNQSAIESACNLYYADQAVAGTASYPATVAALVPDFLATNPQADPPDAGCTYELLTSGVPAAIDGRANCTSVVGGDHSIH